MQAISGLISVMRDLKGQDSLCSSIGISVLSIVNSNPIDYSKYLDLCERFWRENSDHRFCTVREVINPHEYILTSLINNLLMLYSMLLKFGLQNPCISLYIDHCILIIFGHKKLLFLK